MLTSLTSMQNQLVFFLNNLSLLWFFVFIHGLQLPAKICWKYYVRFLKPITRIYQSQQQEAHNSIFNNGEPDDKDYTLMKIIFYNNLERQRLRDSYLKIQLFALKVLWPLPITSWKISISMSCFGHLFNKHLVSAYYIKYTILQDFWEQ